MENKMKLADLIIKGLLVVAFFLSAYYANGAWVAADRNYRVLLDRNPKFDQLLSDLHEARVEHVELMKRCGD